MSISYGAVFSREKNSELSQFLPGFHLEEYNTQQRCERCVSQNYRLQEKAPATSWSRDSFAQVEETAG